MIDRTSRSCTRCGTRDIERGRHSPEGHLCQKCSQRALRIHGACASCGVERLTPGIATDFHCTRCGEEDELVRVGLCARCCLGDDLEQILDDGSGRVMPELLPLLEALVAQTNPRSARIWLTVNPETTQLLREIADGTVTLEHTTFIDHAMPKRVKHLRDLCTNLGLLPDYDRDIAAFEE